MVVDSNRLWSVIEKVKSSCRGRYAGGCLSLIIRQGNTGCMAIDSFFHTIISMQYNIIRQQKII